MKFALGLMLAISASAATVDGMRIHWTSTGTGPKTLVLVHGWIGSSVLWDAQVPELAKKYRVITLDLPGHGESAAPKDGKFSMELFARAVEAVRVEAKAEKIVVTGHSMGGPVVLEYARMFPQHTSAVVLVDGVVAKAQNAGVYVSISKRFAGTEGMQLREDFIRAMFTVTPPDLQSRVLKVTNAAPEATAIGAMAAMGDPAIWKDDPLPFPSLAIYADHSKLADHETLLKIFPSIDYVEIPQTDHFLMMEKPEEFNRVLIAFVDKLK